MSSVVKMCELLRTEHHIMTYLLESNLLCLIFLHFSEEKIVMESYSISEVK